MQFPETHDASFLAWRLSEDLSDEKLECGGNMRILLRTGTIWWTVGYYGIHLLCLIKNVTDILSFQRKIAVSSIKWFICNKKHNIKNVPMNEPKLDVKIQLQFVWPNNKDKNFLGGTGVNNCNVINISIFSKNRGLFTASQNSNFV